MSAWQVTDSSEYTKRILAKLTLIPNRKHVTIIGLLISISKEILVSSRQLQLNLNMNRCTGFYLFDGI